MILEHALLPVRPDRQAEFEAAFARARPLIAGMPGFRGLSLSRCLEDDGTYLLLVEWDSLADHTVGFRGSPEYQEWRQLLHHFYDPFPTVWHFTPVQREIATPPLDAVVELLRSRGAEGIEHPGGTLDGHLERVRRRLAELGASTDVQLAGRAHAVYGTDGFDVPLLRLDERPLLADLIGADAERLVYRYGACDRSRTWGELAVTRRVHDRFTGEVEVLTAEEARAFAELSLVNELDVAEHAPGFLDQHGDYFRRLTAEWAALLGAAVTAEAHRVLGTTGSASI